LEQKLYNSHLYVEYTPDEIAVLFRFKLDEKIFDKFCTFLEPVRHAIDLKWMSTPKLEHERRREYTSETYYRLQFGVHFNASMKADIDHLEYEAIQKMESLRLKLAPLLDQYHREQQEGEFKLEQRRREEAQKQEKWKQNYERQLADQWARLQPVLDVVAAEAELRRLLTEAPNEIKPEDWFSHALIVAAQGFGKTNALRWRIEQLIPDIRDGKASLVLLDPKGTLIGEMLTLARAQGLENRTIFIDPFQAPVSINLFDRGDGSPAALDETIARISRVLSTITSDLTAFQKDTLTYALRALFALPERPSLGRLTSILRGGKNALPMERLPAATQEFFEYDFKDTDGRFVIARLNTLRNGPVFESLFDTNQLSFDIGKEMQAGRLIIINASGTQSLYGRVWIEEIGRTIRPRIAMQGRQLDTTLIIDEAPDFIETDRHFAEIIDQARQARIGIFIAAQHMAQFKDDHLRNSIYNCALKFVSRTSADMTALCRNMGNCDSEFITTTPRFQFVFYSPDLSNAIRVKLEEVKFPQARKEDMDFFVRAAQSAAPRPVTLKVENDGHIYPVVHIGGVAIRMLVDTGASGIVLTMADATRIGINTELLNFSEPAHTANGQTLGAKITLRELKIDDIRMQNVPATVLRNLDISLLGQTFLRNLQSYHATDETLTLNPKRNPNPGGFDTEWKER
jgi:aspartyl protease family protein